MSRDAPYIDMRWERQGYEATEAEAKVRVVEAYEELLRRARQAAVDLQHGRVNNVRPRHPSQSPAGIRVDVSL
jgi:hypothetical protein